MQRYLDGLRYNTERGGATVRSPRRVMRDRTAHCAEGAFLAAAAFRVHGRPPLVVDLEADRDDDHDLAVYRERGLWGAVATSKFAGLRFRPPVFRTIRELVMSYFNDYYNFAGERTLRAYSRPISLARFDPIGWTTSISRWFGTRRSSRGPSRDACHGSTAARTPPACWVRRHIDARNGRHTRTSRFPLGSRHRN